MPRSSDLYSRRSLKLAFILAAALLIISAALPAAFASSSWEAASMTGWLAAPASDLTIASVSGSWTYHSTGTLMATLKDNGSPLSGKNVDFTVNGVAVGSAVTDASGVATLAVDAVNSPYISSINAGTYPDAVTATFAGDVTYNSNSSKGTLTVNKGEQSITFDPLPNKTAADADFTVQADDSVNGFIVVFSASGACTMSGAATVHITSAGSCTVTASHGGDNNYNPATPVSRTFNVSKATVTPTLTFSANPAELGQAVTFTAVVPSQGATPTGLIQFKVSNGSGEENVGAPVALDASGKATITWTSSTIGVYGITAEYSGDGNFNPSEVFHSLEVAGPGTISIEDTGVTEGDSGTTIATFRVRITPSNKRTVTVNYATADGTAQAGSDYQPASGTLTFNPGETLKTISVTIFTDTKDEPGLSEYFVLNLSNIQNALPGRVQATCDIGDDDEPFLRFAKGVGYIVDEGAGHLDITMIRSGDLSNAVTVDYATSDAAGSTPCQNSSVLYSGTNTDNASERCDYVTTVGTLRFAAGETTKTITIPLIDDAYVEKDEAFKITFSNPHGLTISTPSMEAVIDIQDNDTQPATVNPIENQAFFIRQQYLDFLGREPEQAGFNFWMNRMNNCPAGQVCDRIDTSLRFFQSDEFQTRGFYVYRLYDAVLGRLPKYAEFVPDVARLNGFQTVTEQRLSKDAYLLDFMNKQEFRNLYGAYVSADGLTAFDAAGFVNALCQKAGVTPAAKDSLINNLQSGARTPAQTLEDFILQPELSNTGTRFYDRGFITMQYFGYLRRDPEQAGFDFWQNQLIGPNAPHKQDYRFMVGGFLQSDEYCFRFAMISAKS